MPIRTLAPELSAAGISSQPSEASGVSNLRCLPDELEGLQDRLSDTYFCNFSIFQSLPDALVAYQR